jgi:hypothetical protein
LLGLSAGERARLVTMLLKDPPPAPEAPRKESDQ